jgi:hypothetical protein
VKQHNQASRRMNKAALYNLASGAFCVTTGLATGSSVTTTEGIESLVGDTVFHSANAKGKRGVAIGALVLGGAILVATEAKEFLGPTTQDSALGTFAVASSLGANVASYKGLLPHDHEYEEGDALLNHERASKLHSFGDMAGSIIALVASGLAIKYGVADRIGTPIQVGVRLGFYKMERDILNGRSKKLGNWLTRKYVD